jgi:hypothetical protein
MSSFNGGRCGDAVVAVKFDELSHEESAKRIREVHETAAQPSSAADAVQAPRR